MPSPDNEFDVGSETKTLSLWGKHLGPAGCDRLIKEVLFSHRCLTSIELDWNGLEDLGACALAAAIKENGALPLVTLSLVGNSIGALGAKAVGDLLPGPPQAASGNLTALPGAPDAGRLSLPGTEAGSSSPSSYVCLIRDLNLECNVVADEGVTALCDGLSTNTSVTMLALGRNSLTAAGATSLGTMLQTNSTISSLSFEHNTIGPDGASALSSSLKKNSTLTKLNLWQTGIMAEGARSLAGLLLNPAEPVKPHHHSGGGARARSGSLDVVQCVEVSGQGDTGAAHGGETGNVRSDSARLSSSNNMCRIAELNIENNEILVLGGMALASALSNNEYLTRLDVGRNGVGSAVAAAFATSLKSNNTLISLGLLENSIGDGGINHLEKALRSNTTITSLSLRLDTLEDDSVRRGIRGALERNKGEYDLARRRRREALLMEKEDEKIAKGLESEMVAMRFERQVRRRQLSDLLVSRGRPEMLSLKTSTVQSYINWGVLCTCATRNVCSADDAVDSLLSNDNMAELMSSKHHSAVLQEAAAACGVELVGAETAEMRRRKKEKERKKKRDKEKKTQKQQQQQQQQGATGVIDGAISVVSSKVNIGGGGGGGGGGHGSKMGSFSYSVTDSPLSSAPNTPARTPKKSSNDASVLSLDDLDGIAMPLSFASADSAGAGGGGLSASLSNLVCRPVIGSGYDSPLLPVGLTVPPGQGPPTSLAGEMGGDPAAQPPSSSSSSSVFTSHLPSAASIQSTSVMSTTVGQSAGSGGSGQSGILLSDGGGQQRQSTGAVYTPQAQQQSTPLLTGGAVPAASQTAAAAAAASAAVPLPKAKAAPGTPIIVNKSTFLSSKAMCEADGFISDLVSQRGGSVLVDRDESVRAVANLQREMRQMDGLLQQLQTRAVDSERVLAQYRDDLEVRSSEVHSAVVEGQHRNQVMQGLHVTFQRKLDALQAEVELTREMCTEQQQQQQQQGSQEHFVPVAAVGVGVSGSSMLSPSTTSFLSSPLPTPSSSSSAGGSLYSGSATLGGGLDTASLAQLVEHGEGGASRDAGSVTSSGATVPAAVQASSSSASSSSATANGTVNSSACSTAHAVPAVDAQQQTRPSTGVTPLSLGQLTSTMCSAELLSLGDELEAYLRTVKQAQVEAISKEREEIRREKEEVEERKLCKVCNEKDISICLVPCGHYCLCGDCSSLMTVCPLCRADIVSKIVVWAQ